MSSRENTELGRRFFESQDRLKGGPQPDYAGLLIRAGLYLWAPDRLRGRGGETIDGFSPPYT